MGSENRMMSYRVIRTSSCNGRKTYYAFYKGSDINEAFKEFQTLNNSTSRAIHNDPSCHCAFDILPKEVRQ